MKKTNISLQLFIFYVGILTAAPFSFAAGESDNQPMNPTSTLVWSNFLVSLVPALLIVFGCIVVMVQYRYLLKTEHDPATSRSAFILPLIVTGTLVLASTGMHKEDLGVVIGLFGTIAGYILGRTELKKNSYQAPSQKNGSSQDSNDRKVGGSSE